MSPHGHVIWDFELVSCSTPSPLSHQHAPHCQAAVSKARFTFYLNDMEPHVAKAEICGRWLPGLAGDKETGGLGSYQALFHGDWDRSPHSTPAMKDLTYSPSTVLTPAAVSSFSTP